MHLNEMVVLQEKHRRRMKQVEEEQPEVDFYKNKLAMEIQTLKGINFTSLDLILRKLMLSNSYSRILMNMIGLKNFSL